MLWKGFFVPGLPPITPRLESSPWLQTQGMSTADVAAADAALDRFLTEQGIDMGQDVYRTSLRPATKADILKAVSPEDASVTLFDRAWTSGQEVLTITSGASKQDLVNMKGSFHEMVIELPGPKAARGN